MKKYSLIFACVAFAVAVALNFTISKEGKMDDMALANVEALAQESGGTTTCYNSIRVKDGMTVMYCGECKSLNGTSSSSASKC